MHYSDEALTTLLFHKSLNYDEFSLTRKGFSRMRPRRQLPSLDGAMPHDSGRAALNGSAISANVAQLGDFLFKIANHLRGPYRPPQYRKVMLPMTVLRRLDGVIAATHDKVLEQKAALKGMAPDAVEKVLKRKFRLPFVNTSKFTFAKLLNDPDKIAYNLTAYIKGFSADVQKIFSKFEFEKEIERLDGANRLFKIVKEFAAVDLSPARVSNLEMGYLFEELVRKYNEDANEEAGDHFTPREVIRLMVHLLFEPDSEVFKKEGLIRTIYDPACGTGGMLSTAEEYVREHTKGLTLDVFGQEYNDESYAICGSDLMLKGENPGKIVFGDTLGDGKTFDGYPGHSFHYMLSNPPFGVEWKNEEDVVRKEYEDHGFKGRFGPGLPRINDGALLFLMHMINKRKPSPEEGGEGSRIAIVFNGSPLFSGDAASGESNMRRWIIENDWLEAIVALPDQMFYNTGILTYIWIVTNRKAKVRRGKVQLINAVSFYQKMKKSLGDKRNELSEAQIAEIARLHGGFAEGPNSKIFRNQEFGYIKLTVERPLRLRFRVTENGIQRLAEESAFASLIETKKRKDKKEAAKEIARGEALQRTIIEALRTMDITAVWDNRPDFVAALDQVFDRAEVTLKAPLRKAFVAALSERDEGAAVCYLGDDPDNGPEPDPELRDTENASLPIDFKLPASIGYDKDADNDKLVKAVKAHCDAYFDREVKPYAPDAWIDYEKTKLGYEIPITRHFYKYEPPRPVDEIEAELKVLESEIAGMLAEVK